MKELYGLFWAMFSAVVLGYVFMAIWQTFHEWHLQRIAENDRHFSEFIDRRDKFHVTVKKVGSINGNS